VKDFLKGVKREGLETLFKSPKVFPRRDILEEDRDELKILRN